MKCSACPADATAWYNCKRYCRSCYYEKKRIYPSSLRYRSKKYRLGRWKKMREKGVTIGKI